ncbi:CHASE2 domain-containing protein, partial [Acinetobacter baumannii]
VEKIDTAIYDMRMRWQPTIFNPDIVIVNIDEKSLNEVGQWPWNRGVVADLITRLTDDYHVKAVGIDIVFAEPDSSSGIQVL